MPYVWHSKKKIKVCLWNTDYAPPAAKKSKKSYFRAKVKVKRSLTLVSFERTSLVEYACQIWSLYRSKVIANVKVDNRETNKQTKRQDKIIRSGGIKMLIFSLKLNSSPNPHRPTQSSLASRVPVRYNVHLVLTILAFLCPRPERSAGGI